MYVPKRMFLTKGTGKHRERLASFEMALRNAGIAAFNLVSVSSIYPPDCKIISREVGLDGVSPIENLTHPDFFMAKFVYKLIGYKINK